MSAAYSPQAGTAPQMGQQQQYPPPQVGYAPPGAPWQNYPPPGYPPQPQQAGWPPVMNEHAPCPMCRRPGPEKVNFTWWGGVLGPRMFSHVKCQGCGTTYNGKTGQSNTTNIVAYSIVAFVIFFALFMFIFFGLR
jgi:hypothetical protein